jgi:hypothetical protein
VLTISKYNQNQGKLRVLKVCHHVYHCLKLVGLKDRDGISHHLHRTRINYHVYVVCILCYTGSFFVYCLVIQIMKCSLLTYSTCCFTQIAKPNYATSKWFNSELNTKMLCKICRFRVREIFVL